MEQKKAWIKPALVLLVRAEPAAAVLSYCKTVADAGTPSNIAVGCLNHGFIGNEGYCYSCQQNYFS